MLAKSGVPWDMIMELDDEMRMGMCIRVGMLDGGVFDWDAKQWVNKNG